MLLVGLLLSLLGFGIVESLAPIWIAWRSRWLIRHLAEINYSPSDIYASPPPGRWGRRMPFLWWQARSLMFQKKRLMGALDAQVYRHWRTLLSHYFQTSLERARPPLPVADLWSMFLETTGLIVCYVALYAYLLFHYPDMRVSGSGFSMGQGAMALLMFWLVAFIGCRIEVRRLALVVALCAHFAGLLQHDVDLPELTPVDSDSR
jgi:hypothetical protein